MEDKLRRSGRVRRLTMEGQEYEMERCSKRLNAAVTKVNLLLESITISISNGTKDVGSVRREYGTWLKAYEQSLVVQEEYQAHMDGDGKVREDENSGEANEQYRKFKAKVERWLLDNEKQEPMGLDSDQDEHHVSASQSGSRGSGSSGGSSRLSEMMVKAEQEKAEIMAKTAALKERREMEQAKVDLTMKEEELELKVQLAVAEAKAKVLENFGSAASHYSRVSSRSRRSLTQKPKLAELDKHAKPETAANVTDASATSIAEVARELKKPQAEIRKFSGSPLDYRKFLRQFNSRITAYTDNDDERLCFLEQYTTDEARRIVQGYSHLAGSVGYKAALQELETRYGDPEVIGSAYVQKVLRWPSIKPDNPKALDEYGVKSCH
ncbi:PREDICTED: uncharacterized protein LOC106811088 [Priapulus caudatus]|uniref:Uncharacterized protein LOC106811088 n=1 Tax=Priapulus caudatus TaxID=37621 RepID=A0ABM1ED33_PRICU|nr:PREDICTED: uncharacterized protein LOC106811088 [Priapulus caudatus]